MGNTSLHNHRQVSHRFVFKSCVLYYYILIFKCHLTVFPDFSRCILTGGNDNFSSNWLQCTNAGSRVDGLFNIITNIIQLFSFITIVTSNIIIGCTLHKSNQQHRDNASSRKATITLSIICWVFVASCVPLFILFAVKGVIGKDPPQWMFILCQFLLSLNVVSNPVVYSMTNQRFAMWLRSLVQYRKVAPLEPVTQPSGAKSAQSTTAQGTTETAETEEV